MAQSWDIVFWNTKESVDYVPSIWVGKNNSYKWPKGLSQKVLQEYIDSCHPLENIPYRFCKGEARMKNICRLDDAKRFCNKALYSSGLESTDCNSNRSSSDCEDTINLEEELPLEPPVMSLTTENRNIADTEEILKHIRSLKYDVSLLAKKVDQISNILSIKFNTITDVNPEKENAVYKLLPLKNLEEVENIETVLTDSNSLDELINIMFLCGGQTYHKAIFIQMGRLMTKDCTLKFSGMGKKGKKPFIPLKIFEALKCATRKRFTDATDEQIKKSVSLYLSGAKDRLGGRKSRDHE